MAAVAAVCAAALQGGGRLLVAALPVLEPRLNSWLASRDIAVEGLWGAWRHLNPIVGAASLTFPGAEFQDIALELDVMESLWRNRIVARRFEVGASRLRLTPGPSGWRLAGSTATEGPDLEPFFLHSDEVRLATRLEFEANEAVGALDLEFSALNRGASHRWRAAASTDPNCAACSLQLDADIHRTGPGVGEQSGAAHVVARSFRLPETLGKALSVPSMALEGAGYWSGDGTDAVSHGNLRATEIALPGAPARVVAAASARGTHGLYRGAASLRAGTDEVEVSLPDIGFAADAAGAITLWTELLDLGAWNALLVSALGPADPVGHWFDGVDARGELSNPRLHVDRDGIAYQGSLRGAYTSSFNGIPQLDDAHGRLRGHLHALHIALEGEPMRAAMPEHFDGEWRYDSAVGDVTLWFDIGYVGLRGTGRVRSALADVELALALTRPSDPIEGHLSMVAKVHHTSVEHAKQFVPRGLGRPLGPWLGSALVAGHLDNGTMAYHGHTRTLPNLPMRRIAMAGAVRDGVVAYHPDWPRAEELRGRLVVSGTSVRARLDRAVSLGLPVSGVDVDVPSNAGFADVRFSARPNARDAFAFVFATPIAELVPFACPCWEGDGAVGLAASLRVPFDGPPAPGDIEVDFDLAGVSLDLSDLRLRFGELAGAARYRSPHHLTAARIDGTLFGFPVRIEATSNDDAVSFDLRGRAGVADVLEVLDMDPLPSNAAGHGVARGVFDFDARFDLFAAPDRPPALRASTDAVGVVLDLPEPLAKDADTPRPLVAHLLFADDAVHARGGDDVASWWLRVDADAELLGAVGIGIPPSPRELVEEGILIGGALEQLDASGTSFLSDAPLHWGLDGLAVDQVRLHDFELRDARLDGTGGDGAFDLRFDSNEMTGSLAMRPGEPLQVDLTEIRLPGGETGVDPLDVSAIPLLPAADVIIHRVLLDGEHFGSWRFGVRPKETTMHFTDVSGDIKGLRIDASEDIVWTADDQSQFQGTIGASNLASVLPAWGYATSVESTSVDIIGDVTWPGSPLNFQLDYLSGEIGLTVRDGRFLDVAEVPAGRILTLFDFSKLAQRLRFDFSDVFGRGIGFDRIRATTRLEGGVLHFEEPLEIKGPSSAFRIYGTVDFHDGALDNDMVVTLPLSSSLPWYAVWLASTNPATAAGVLLGREVFKRQIDALSSARYRVTGTLEEPEPSFVGIFTGEFTPDAGEAASSAEPSGNP